MDRSLLYHFILDILYIVSLSLRYHRVDDKGFLVFFFSLSLRYHRLDDTGILDNFSTCLWVISLYVQFFSKVLLLWTLDHGLDDW